VVNMARPKAMAWRALDAYESEVFMNMSEAWLRILKRRQGPRCLGGMDGHVRRALAKSVLLPLNRAALLSF
jgi:hypothetical protein